MKKSTVAVGPFGGGKWESWDHGVHKGIRQMVIRSGIVVDFISVEYEDDDGRFRWSDKLDDTNAKPGELIKLDYPDEYLTSISGYSNTYLDRIFISSITLSSNKRRFRSFGTIRGNYFLIPSFGGKFVGLFGCYGPSYCPYLLRIGVHLEPISPFKFVGPFGGNGGSSWDDGPHTTVRRITVASESVINSILIEYQDDGELVSSSRHGESDLGNKYVVELDHPDEYVTLISGYYSANHSPVVLRSLTFQTNRRVFGPFGAEKGKYFSFPPTDGKIIGFHGRCGAHLDSIGGHLEHTSNLYAMKSVSPFGERKGNLWDDGIHFTIKGIRIVHGAFISSIWVEYCTYGGSLVWSKQHGGDWERNTDMIELDFPDEFLTSVSGYYDSVNDMNDNAITSLAFQSNRRTYGPFGRQFGTYFSFPSFDGKIVGFYGRSLYAIGAHVESISYPKPSEFISAFGGQGRDHWDDGFYTTIRQMVITCGSQVNSVCIEYDKNGHSTWSSKHGESTGNQTYTIKLDYPDEFLILLSGSYNSDSCSTTTIIQSLTIQSNKRTYGPFGIENENNGFSLSSACGKIIGFHGTSGDYLNSIGVYLKPIPMSYQYETIEPKGWKSSDVWDDGVYTTVRQLIIGAGSVIDSIQIEYDKHGGSVWSSRHGASIGGNKYMVKLDYPSEYLVSISGYYGLNASPYIHCLKIQSNRRTFGPFGSARGDHFSISSHGKKIIGFHGTSSHYLSSLGVYIKRPISLGPFGGLGGDPWDDGVHAALRQIQLTVREFGIESIRFEYENNGRSLWCEKHGSKAEGKLETVLLDHPNEFLISASGTYGADYGLEIVQSITFISNMRSYGPFGLEKGAHFNLASAGDKLAGFHGRCGFYLDSIGANKEPVSYW